LALAAAASALAAFAADSDDHAHAFRNIDARAFRYFNAHPWSDVGLVDKPVQSSFVKSA
jgi:hypothetical protein